VSAECSPGVAGHWVGEENLTDPDQEAAMVDFKRITDRAKDLVEKRGGSDSLKQDADQLRDIAKGPGSFKDKAKAAVDAIKDPGAAAAAESSSTPPPAAGAAEQKRAAGKVEGEERGKHRHAGEGQGRHRKGGGRRGGKGRGDGDPAV
jgi:hypothetical protein